MRKKLLQFALIFIYLLVPFLSPLTIKAASDFEITSNLTLNYKDKSDFVEVSDEVMFKVNNDKYFLQSGLTQTFFLTDYSNENVFKERDYKLKSLKVENIFGTSMKYTTKEVKEGIEIAVKIPNRISAFEEYSLIITYKTHDLVNVSGSIVNMYVPGLPKDTSLSDKGDFNLTTTYKYNTKIITDKSVPLPSYTQPGNITLKETEKTRTYTIDVKDRIGKVSWLQFGSTQYYKFKLVQEALKTDNLTPTPISDLAPIVSTNIYTIALPREYDETSQSILIKSLEPKPTKIERDSDGNLLATFEVPANKNSQIVIEGFISLQKKDLLNKVEIKDINLSEYKSRLSSLEDLQTYTQADKYWESDDKVIKDIADKLYGESSSILELVQKDYEYVVDKFNYSFEKLEKENIRLGAKAALTGAQTICMEYSDALTAILRAQGIPTRIAIGYGNDPHATENNIENDKLNKQLIGHQWTQVWIPDYGWMSVDPTWGESQRTYIGSDLDHILWYTVGSSKQNITDVIFYSAERSGLGDYEVYLQALDQNSFNNESKDTQSLDQMLVTDFKGDIPVDFYLKTSLAGRILIYLLPIFATVLVSIGITSLIYYTKRKFKKN